MKILVAGGAGYIGSHMVKMLAQLGHDVVVFDNLSTGHRWAVKWGELVEGDLLNSEDLKSQFASHQFDAVMHFSARSLVGESMQNPGLYWQNNVTGTLNLLNESFHTRSDLLGVLRAVIRIDAKHGNSAVF